MLLVREDAVVGLVTRVAEMDDGIQLDEALQQIIDELALSSRGRPHEQIAADLRQAIRARDLEDMPEPWIDSVVTEAANGNAYVISTTTARASPVSPPSTKNPPTAIT